ncbi:MAG: carboxylating nicotinate-nucleotide diphosphorylase [Thermoanaerobaculia bacterium]
MRKPSTTEIEDIVERALAEDLPDITGEAIFGAEEKGMATIVAKENGVLAGMPFVRAVFATLDSAADVETMVDEGGTLEPGTTVARISARVRALLAGERTALNLLQRASGIATATRRYVDAVRGTSAKIYDTRKTAPGLRALDKYAVVAGGGENHRYAARDMFLIKNNHIDHAGSIAAAIRRVRESGREEKVMVEVRSFEELDQAVAESPDLILLDNMTTDEMREAVRRVAGRIPLEASGGITLESVRAIAETGVERISVGALTHSVKALDLSMKASGEG